MSAGTIPGSASDVEHSLPFRQMILEQLEGHGVDSGGADGGAESQTHGAIPVTQRLKPFGRSGAGSQRRRRFVSDVDCAVGGEQSGADSFIADDALRRQKSDEIRLSLRLTHAWTDGNRREEEEQGEQEQEAYEVTAVVL